MALKIRCNLGKFRIADTFGGQKLMAGRLSIRVVILHSPPDRTKPVLRAQRILVNFINRCDDTPARRATADDLFPKQEEGARILSHHASPTTCPGRGIKTRYASRSGHF